MKTEQCHLMPVKPRPAFENPEEMGRGDECYRKEIGQLKWELNKLRKIIEAWREFGGAYMNGSKEDIERTFPRLIELGEIE